MADGFKNFYIPVRVRRADGKVPLQGQRHHHEDGAAHGHVVDDVHDSRHRVRV